MHGVGEWLYLCPAQDCSRGVLGQGFPRHWNLVDHMKRVHNCSPKTHNSDPVGGCTVECNGATAKNTRRKRVPGASLSVEKVPPSPPINSVVVGSEGQVQQLRSESTQSVTSPTRTESPLEAMIDAPIQSGTDQSATKFIEQLPLETHGHRMQPSLQENTDSAAQAEWTDQNSVVKQKTTALRGFESPPKAVVPVEMPNAERNMHPGIERSPKSNTPDGDSPVKKPPRCTRSKNGCWTCRKRKIKVNFTLLYATKLADS